MSVLRRQIRRRCVLFALALPLLTTGTCVDIAQESLLEGIFDGITTQAAVALQQQTADQTSTDGTTE